MLGAVSIALSFGCSKKAPANPVGEQAPAGPLTIYTVNYPLAYFAERLAPADAKVVLPAPADADPAFWKPSVEAVQKYQQASLILLNGAGYAHWTRYATLPKTRVVVTAKGCRERFIRNERSVQHQHGPEGEHEHGDLAFTTWLDLKLAACQAASVRDALLARTPDEAATINAKFAGLENELSNLDARLRRAGEAWKGGPILASHPVYQYLADAYGLSVVSLHLEPGQTFTEDDWKALDAELERHPATLMLWEGQPLQATEEGLAERGIEVVVFDPAGQAPADADFVTVMEGNVGGLECATGARACD
jgi:zinc transport system substrate-binding protein